MLSHSPLHALHISDLLRPWLGGEESGILSPFALCLAWHVSWEFSCSTLFVYIFSPSLCLTGAWPRSLSWHFMVFARRDFGFVTSRFLTISHAESHYGKTKWWRTSKRKENEYDISYHEELGTVPRADAAVADKHVIAKHTRMQSIAIITLSCYIQSKPTFPQSSSLPSDDRCKTDDR